MVGRAGGGMRRWPAPPGRSVRPRHGERPGDVVLHERVRLPRRREHVPVVGGVCDVVETCTGVSPPAPPTALRPPRRSVARVPVSATSRNCTGGGVACPADAKEPNGTSCTSDGNPCSLDQCDGSSALCQYPAGNAGATCRGVADVCDVAETCTGVSTICPADGFAPTSVVCRTSAGECDPADTCTGSGPACPADAKSPGGTPCSTDGNACTVDECNGTNDACQHPAGNPGAVCRPFAGVCDVPEVCTGSDVDCPADDFLPTRPCAARRAAPATSPRAARARAAYCPADGPRGVGHRMPIRGR